MTEEIEAHVLKKYEILQKLGKSFRSNSHKLLAWSLLKLKLSTMKQKYHIPGLFFTLKAPKYIYKGANAEL